MSTRASPSRGSPHSPGSSSPRSRHSRHHRGTVIVEQNLLSVKSTDSEKQDGSPQRKSTSSLSNSGDSGHKQLSPLQRKSTGSFSDHRDSHRSSPDSSTLPILSPPASFVSMDHRYSTDSLTQISPPDSVRSSVSSLVDTASSVSNLAIVTSTEDRLLDELKRQIAQGALRIQHLEKQVEDIPLLTVKVDEVERERGKLANDLLDSQEIVQSMKQRLSLLHEQNNQLVKLAHPSGGGGGSSELLRNRNALVASLAQIKKLQERVDSIPSLKAQVRALTDENTQLKEKEVEMSKKFPDQLPEGVTRASYQALLEENAKLTETNQKLSEEVKMAADKLTAVSSNLDNVKKRMDKFESMRSIAVPLQQKIKRLEKEKDELYQQFVEVKFHQQPSMDIDTAHLLNELTSLKKKSSHLQAKLEQVTIDSRQERERLVLKLFELESLNINSQKYDLERRILEASDTQLRPESRQVSSTTSNHTSKAYREDDELSDLPAESKVQMLKLQQLKVHSEQSRNMLQTLISERDGLEKKVEELTATIEQRAIGDLEKSVEEKDYKLQRARETIAKLERELKIANSIGTEQTAVEAANKELTKEVERLRENQSNYDELVSAQSQAKHCMEEHDTLMLALQKAKEEKIKAEKKYKEGKSRLRSLAKELSSSVELIQKYQTQCMKLQELLDQAEEDLKSVRSVSASYKAKLEVAEAESSSNEGTIEEKDGESGSGLYDKVCKERDDLQATVESLSKTISEQQAQLWKLKSEKEEQQSESVSRLSEANQKLETVTQELNNSKQQLEKEAVSLASVRTELGAMQSTHGQLQTEHKQMTERSAVLEGDLLKAKESITDLTKAKTDLDSLVKQLRQAHDFELKAKSSGEAEKTKLTQDLKATQQNVKQLQGQLKEKDKALEQESSLKKQREKELSELRSQMTQLTSQVGSLCKEKEALSAQHKDSQEEATKLTQTMSAKIDELTSELSREAKQHQEALIAKKALEGELQQVRVSAKKTATLKMDADGGRKKALVEKDREITALEVTVTSLRDEVEGYKATIKSLQRHVEQAETREVEHERLKQNFKQLEKALGTSSHDNKALFAILQQTLKELPSYSSEASRSLQDENLRLEEQISVLSQWNDKQRSEIETLERVIEGLEDEKGQLLGDIQSKDNLAQENSQLKRELKEVEMEVGILRRQARSELQEEYTVKMETQGQLLAVFNQHNTSLQKQVKELTSHVQQLGGTLERDKPVSPPPMPDVSLAIPRGEEARLRTVGDLERENYILKERIGTMERELVNLQDMSSQFRRRSSSLRAMFSVPVGSINEELQVNVPPELLLPCSLLADHISDRRPIKDAAEGWLESIRNEWFACMAQRTLTPACAQCYISTLSRLSNSLMEIVINLQDEKGNTALHYAVANGNFKVAGQFIRLRCCNACLLNKAGYNPLMLAAACCAEVGEHRDIVGHLIDRSGINCAAGKDQRTALMLAACSGSVELVGQFLEKGSDVNLRDKDGSTALMFAAQSGHTEIAGLLLSNPNTDHTIKDNDGLTALDIAKEAGFGDMVALLSKHSKSKFKR